LLSFEYFLFSSLLLSLSLFKKFLSLLLWLSTLRFKSLTKYISSCLLFLFLFSLFNSVL
jgi:hypothetical protein